MKKFVKLFISIALTMILTACGTLPQVSAQERLFLNLSLEFLGEYQLPKQTFQDTVLGGLSALTYDRQKNQFYAISDDRSQKAPARFYTLNLKLNNQNRLDKVTVEAVTVLHNEKGETYPANTSDTEGIALSPQGTVFISSEGVPSQGIDAWIGEFELKTGQLLRKLPIPQRYLANSPDQSPRGVRENLGFESLTINGNSLMKADPFRLFTATESALLQDNPPKTPTEVAKIRLMHYVINPIGSPVLVAEHLYLLDSASNDTILNGLCELLALEKEGYWLSLERTLGLSGFGAKIFQFVNSNATDTSQILSFAENVGKVEPLRKKLLLDLNTLGVELDNLEGMTLGPGLPDGSRTLVLLSDDNFKKEQVTQFLIFRLLEK